MRKKSIVAALTSLMMLSGILTGYTYQDGIGNVYYESGREIARQTAIREQIAGHPTNGIQHAYMVESDLSRSNLEPYVFSGEVTSKYTIASMIDWIEKEGYKVVAGINGDLYDTSSGAPKGLTVHNGKIISSGYAPEYVLAFDAEGRAFASGVSLNYSMTGTGYAVDASGAHTPETHEFSLPIGYVNVPHGGAKALHMFNRQYAATTKTSGNCVEVVLEAASTEDAQLSVDGTIKATVISVNLNTKSTPIGDNQIVLSTKSDSATAATLATLVPGSEIALSASDPSGNLTNAKEVIGSYYLLAQNGQFYTVGTNVNPRTLVGIKDDGSVVIYALDGRQSSVSVGLGLTDAAKHLMAQGCTTVLNMDGGGSTSFAVRYPGISGDAKPINSPSEGTFRKVTNGLFLVYKDQGSKTAENLHVYSAMTLAMPGASVQFKTYASDSAYEQVSLPGVVNYSVSQGDGMIDGSGIFTAGANAGLVEITAESEGLTATAKVDVITDVTITPSVTSLNIEQGGTKDINVTAKYGYASVTTQDNIFTWSCDPDIGTIDANGVFTATAEPAVTGNIYVSFGESSKTIPVQVGGTKTTFSDIKEHWAKDYIETLASKKIVSGMGEGTFRPDMQLSRAQFLTMLAGCAGADTAAAQASGFSDVNPSDWYYSYVNWGVANGIVNGMDETTFAPDANITREQMTIMLKNYTTFAQKTLGTDGNTTFTDSELISPWALEAVKAIAAGGIMSGRPEGNFDPQGLATRAEAATVIYQMITK